METKEIKTVSCDDCQSNIRKYADGYILKDFSKFTGDVSVLPEQPDNSIFWTYQECKKNKGKLQHINLSGDCKEFKKK